MLCERCKKALAGNQRRWCSPKCIKLGLKALYRKRKREEINLYNRNYRRKLRSVGGTIGGRKKRQFKFTQFICLKCGSEDSVEQHHVKPRILGGRNPYNIIFLCKKHHYDFEQLTKGFWLGD